MTRPGCVGEVTGAADLFDAGTVEAVAGRLVRVLGAVAAEPGLRVSQVDVLDGAEREQLVAGWNDTAVELAPGEMVPGLIAAQVARVPDAVAVVCGGECVSYAGAGCAGGAAGGVPGGAGGGPGVGGGVVPAAGRRDGHRGAGGVEGGGCVPAG